VIVVACRRLKPGKMSVSSADIVCVRPVVERLPFSFFHFSLRFHPILCRLSLLPFVGW